MTQQTTAITEIVLSLLPNIKLEGPVASEALCAVKTCVGNWNENLAHVSEISAYRSADYANSRGTPIFRLHVRAVGASKTRGPS